MVGSLLLSLLSQTFPLLFKLLASLTTILALSTSRLSKEYSDTCQAPKILASHTENLSRQPHLRFTLMRIGEMTTKPVDLSQVTCQHLQGELLHGTQESNRQLPYLVWKLSIWLLLAPFARRSGSILSLRNLDFTPHHPRTLMSTTTVLFLSPRTLVFMQD